MRHPSLLRYLGAFLSSVYLSTNCLFAHVSEVNFWTERRRPGNLLAGIPSRNRPDTLIQYGSIRKILKPKLQISKSQSIIHIQDIHMNPEAQKSIADAVRFLFKDNQPGVLALEGGFGSIDLTPFRTFPDQEIVRKVADYMLRENKISGAMRAALRNSNFSVVGIDDRAHYDSNVEAYLRSIPFAEERKAELAAAVRALADKKRETFSRPLAVFDASVMDYRTGKRNLGSYVEILSKTVSSLPLTIADFLEAHRIESTINFERVSQERERLLGELLLRLNYDEKSDLINAGADIRSGKRLPGDFYGYLKSLCSRENIDLRRFPVLREYLRYVLLADSVDAKKLYEEMKTIEEGAYNFLARTNEEKMLVAESNRLYLTGKLLDFALTQEEWQSYRKGPVSAPHRIFEEFYEQAEIRDQKMADNFLREVTNHKSQNRNLNTYVLVTGGFHSAGIDQRLSEAGYTVQQFVPKITKIDTASGSAYLSFFAQEKAPLAKLFEGEKLFLNPEQTTNLAEGALIQGTLENDALGFSKSFPTTALELTQRISTDGRVRGVWRNKRNGHRRTVEILLDGKEIKRAAWWIATEPKVFNWDVPSILKYPRIAPWFTWINDNLTPGSPSMNDLFVFLSLFRLLLMEVKPGSTSLFAGYAAKHFGIPDGPLLEKEELTAVASKLRSIWNKNNLNEKFGPMDAWIAWSSYHDLATVFLKSEARLRLFPDPLNILLYDVLALALHLGADGPHGEPEHLTWGKLRYHDSEVLVDQVPALVAHFLSADPSVYAGNVEEQNTSSYPPLPKRLVYLWVIARALDKRIHPDRSLSKIRFRKEIIKRLKNLKDPRTGQPFPPETFAALRHEIYRTNWKIYGINPPRTVNQTQEHVKLILRTQKPPSVVFSDARFKDPFLLLLGKKQSLYSFLPLILIGMGFNVFNVEFLVPFLALIMIFVAGSIVVVDAPDSFDEEDFLRREGVVRTELEIDGAQRVLYSLGYEQRTPKTFRQLLRKLNVKTLIDIRTIPKSTIAGFNDVDLHELIDIGVNYRHLGFYLGNLHREFTQYMRSDHFHLGVESFHTIAKNSSGPMAILCIEREAQQCHRQHLVRYLSEKFAPTSFPIKQGGLFDGVVDIPRIGSIDELLHRWVPRSKKYRYLLENWGKLPRRAGDGMRYTTKDHLQGLVDAMDTAADQPWFGRFPAVFQAAITNKEHRSLFEAFAVYHDAAKHKYNDKGKYRGRVRIARRESEGKTTFTYPGHEETSAQMLRDDKQLAKGLPQRDLLIELIRLHGEFGQLISDPTFENLESFSKTISPQFDPIEFLPVLFAVCHFDRRGTYDRSVLPPFDKINQLAESIERFRSKDEILADAVPVESIDTHFKFQSAHILNALIGTDMDQQIGSFFLERGFKPDWASQGEIQELISYLERTLQMSPEQIETQQLANKKFRTVAAEKDIVNVQKFIASHPHIKVTLMIDKKSRRKYRTVLKRFGPDRVALETHTDLFNGDILNKDIWGKILEDLVTEKTLEDTVFVLPKDMLDSTDLERITYLLLEDVLEPRKLGILIAVHRATRKSA